MMNRLMDMKNKIALVLGAIAFTLTILISPSGVQSIRSALLIGIMIIALVVSIINYFYRAMTLDGYGKFYLIFKARGLIGLIIIMILIAISYLLRLIS